MTLPSGTKIARIEKELDAPSHRERTAVDQEIVRPKTKMVFTRRLGKVRKRGGRV